MAGWDELDLSQFKYQTGKIKMTYLSADRYVIFHFDFCLLPGQMISTGIQFPTEIGGARSEPTDLTDSTDLTD